MPRALLLLLATALPAWGTTYYVQPGAGCSDDNAGTVAAAPWCTPPGTRNAANTAFLSAGTWGSVSPAAPVRCGDVILLRGGATQTSAVGGAWRIGNGMNGDGSGHYALGCAGASPITVRVATGAEWAGSSGDFVLEGSGVTATAIHDASEPALINLADVENVTLGGAGPTQRLVVRHSSGNGIQAWSSSGGTCAGCGTNYMDQIRVQYAEVANAAARGVIIGRIRNSVFKHLVSHDNAHQGFNTGFANDHRVIDTAFEDCEAYANGPANTVPPYDADAFMFLGCEHCWCVRCQSHDNFYRGLNAGEVGGGFTQVVTLKDSAFWNNGQTGQHNAIWQGGPCNSGDDVDGGIKQWVIGLGTVVYHNREAGGFCAYGEGSAEIWNSVFYRNGYDAAVTSSGNDIAVGDNDGYGIFNTIVQRTGGTPIGTGAPNGGGSSDCPRSDHNLLRPASADTEPLTGFGCQGGVVSGGPYTFATAAAAGWFGPHDKIGAAYPANFVALDPAVYANTDFHVRAGSAAIDAGACLFHTTSAGSGTTISGLTATGQLSDPRLYLRSPASYLDAPGEVLVVGTDVVTVTALTASTISVTPAITWAAGDCIHPAAYTGSNTTPEIGAFGFDAGGSTTTVPPTTSTTTTSTSSTTTIAPPATTTTSTSTTTTTTAPPSTTTTTTSTSTTTTTTLVTGTWPQRDNFNGGGSSLGTRWTRITGSYGASGTPTIVANDLVDGAGAGIVTQADVQGEGPLGSSAYVCGLLSGTGAANATTEVCLSETGTQGKMCCGAYLGNWFLGYTTTAGGFQALDTGARTWGAADYLAIARTGSAYRCAVSTNGTTWTALGAGPTTSGVTLAAYPGFAFWGQGRLQLDAWEAGTGALPTTVPCGGEGGPTTTTTVPPTTTTTTTTSSTTTTTTTTSTTTTTTSTTTTSTSTTTTTTTTSTTSSTTTTTTSTTTTTTLITGTWPQRDHFNGGGAVLGASWTRITGTYGATGTPTVVANDMVDGAGAGIVTQADFESQGILGSSSYVCGLLSGAGATDATTEVCLSGTSTQGKMCCGAYLGNWFLGYTTNDGVFQTLDMGPRAWATPGYIGITRTGSSYRCAASTNGTTWTALGAGPTTSSVTLAVYPGFTFFGQGRFRLHAWEAGTGALPTGMPCGESSLPTTSTTVVPTTTTTTTTLGAICGNGVVEAPETCDLGAVGNGAATTCCTATCTVRPAGQVCRPAAGACDVAERCTGAAVACPADAGVTATTGCTVNGVRGQPCQGGLGVDVIVGTTGADVIRGGPGPDVLQGKAGADLLCGDADNDRLEGGDGNDVVEGGPGDDDLTGDRGDDLLRGGDGADLLNGGGEADVLEGGAGADELLGGPGADMLDGGADADVLDGGKDNDVVAGGAGADVVDGGAGNADRCSDADQAGPFPHCEL